LSFPRIEFAMNPPDSPDRYSRQRLLPEIGIAGQRALGSARVLIVGCGALGSNLAEMLARAGVGFLRIVDRDLVELSNLQRQVLFDESDAKDAVPKAVAAANRLARINSQITVEPIVADVNALNAESLANGDQPIDLILDGTDNVATRYLINDVALKHNIPWIYAACVGVSGRVMPIIPGRTACLRCVFPDPPDPKNLPTCDTAGVLNTAAAAVAALAASWAMRLLVDAGKIGTEDFGLASMNLWTGEFRRLGAAAQVQADCPCCQGRRFDFLHANAVDFTTTLCGRDAVQVLPVRKGESADLDVIAVRWQGLGRVKRSPWFVRCELSEPAGIELTLFLDARLLVRGTIDGSRARSLYARFVGS
jgi:molybdopterin-synthase adenylyltransferase